MEDRILFILAGILMLFQLLTCVFSKKAWLRWLPFGVSVLLTAFCFAMYWRSGWTNWGYLILVGLLGAVLFVQGFILLLNRIIRGLIKQ